MNRRHQGLFGQDWKSGLEAAPLSRRYCKVCRLSDPSSDTHFDFTRFDGLAIDDRRICFSSIPLSFGYGTPMKSRPLSGAPSLFQ